MIKLKKTRWACHVARMGEMKDVYKILIDKPDWKRLLGIPRRRWEDNIKTILEIYGGKMCSGFISHTIGY